MLTVSPASTMDLDAGADGLRWYWTTSTGDPEAGWTRAFAVWMPERSGLVPTAAMVTSWIRRSVSLAFVRRSGIWSVTFTRNDTGVVSTFEPAGAPATVRPACVKQILGTSTVAPHPAADSESA